MDSLSLQDVSFTPKIRQSCSFETESLSAFSYKFTFGKSFLLDGWPWDGNGTLSWIIAGVIRQEHGSLFRNDKIYEIASRQAEAWAIRWSNIKPKRFSIRAATVQQEVQYGLKTFANQYIQTEEEIVRRFFLTPERYKRPIRTLSHEAWRASCAIGLANGKRIFCFPYLRPDFINEYYALWFKEIVDLLKNTGALILIPTTAIGIKDVSTLCDEIVPLKLRP